MLLTESDDQRNAAQEKSTDSPNKDELAAILIAARFMLTIERAKLIVMLAGLGSGAIR
jgi:hypothetical protein